MYVTAGLTDLGNIYLQLRGGPGGARGGVPHRPTLDPGSRQWGGPAARPVYSAVGLCRSRGSRGCVQGLINHGCLGRDKQSGPSRDAAAPATGGRGRGVVSQRTRWGGLLPLHLLLGPRLWAARACKSTFQVWPDADGAAEASARTRGPFPPQSVHV